MDATVQFPSRLPRVGTTIFTTMSALAAEHRAVNLGQGFPDFDCDPKLVALVHDAMRAGHNQYAPMTGVPALRRAIADKVEACHGVRYDADAEITVTAGATQALMAAILCSVQPGDEVIVLEPCYDSYVPAIELAGGVPVYVTMDAPEYRFPLVSPQRGWRSLPLFLRHFRGAVFFDAAHAWSDGFQLSDVKTSAGAALGLDSALGFTLPLQAELVVAHGFQEKGDTRVYFRFGVSF